jgi:NADPH-dependent curcumin reductase CurA
VFILTPSQCESGRHTYARGSFCPSCAHVNHPLTPPRHFGRIYTAQRVEGFVCSPWLRSGAWLPVMAELVREGKIEVEETLFEGIDRWVDGFQSLFDGTNVGKVVVRV